jgi:hypothetical protein
MGWIYDTEPCSRREYIRKHFTGPGADRLAPCRLLKHAAGARGLWTLLEHPNDPGRPFIVLFLLEWDRSARCWGEKAIHEMTGPLEVDCPLSFLDLAPEPARLHFRNDKAQVSSWRDQVRAYHAKKNKIRKLPRLKVGQVVRLGEPFLYEFHGDYTVTANLGRRGYLLGNHFTLKPRERKHVTVITP